MNNKQVSSQFSAKSGERILEIFLLSDAARKEFNKMQEQETKELTRLHDELQARKVEDIRTAKREIMAEQPKPELRPPRLFHRNALKESDLQAAAEHRVDARNTAIMDALAHKHHERQDAFLSRHQEERLVREAQENNVTRNRPSSPSLKRDFEQSR